jgi:recombination protein RecT
MTTQKQPTSVWMQTLTNALPKFESITLNPDKAKVELGFAMQLFQSNASLQKCEPQSIFNAVVNVARTSITLNPVMRLAYLIPRKGKCVLEFSYMGLVAMLRDNGCIKSISAHIVYEDEDFDYDVAMNKIYHKPKYAKTEQEHLSRQKVGCYSRATLPNGENVFEFMPMWEIEKVKRMSEGSSSQYSAWQTWEDEMIKKSVIKRHFKMLISGNPSEALATALEIENDNNKLVNTFDKKEPRKNIMNAFEDVIEENPFQLSIPATDEQIEPETMPIFDMSLSDEQIEAELQKVSEKTKNSDLFENTTDSDIDWHTNPIDDSPQQ